jgi:pyruvate,water dikinase
MSLEANAERTYVRWFEDLDTGAVADVGGKNASLGEMIRNLRGAGINVPDGFATTATAYREFLEVNDLRGRIAARLDDFKRKRTSLARTGQTIRQLFLQGKLPPAIAEAITDAYAELGRRAGRANLDVAVRSSATAEDLPEASFAGQQETFLNIKGDKRLLDACRRCFASLFTDRAIVYRENHGFDHLRVALSVGVQRMVRSDRGGAGVMFSIDTDSGFPRVVLINAAWGLGETVVQGTVDPDEYVVFKPLLREAQYRPIIGKALGAKQRKLMYARGGARPTRAVRTAAHEQISYVLADDEILRLARWAVAIEEHYGRPMDMEWAKDGETGELSIVQARPETVQSRKGAASFTTYVVTKKGKPLVTGLSIGEGVATGKVCRLESPDEMKRFEDRGILVTAMTDPDWMPIMKRAAAIVTDHGGRTSHAAIVSRELGLPAIVGAGSTTASPTSRCARSGWRTSRRRVPRSCSTSLTRGPRSAGGGCRATALAWPAWSSSSATSSRFIRWPSFASAS